MIYECHITTTCTFKEQAELLAKTLHWKTSEISRDPVLGNDTFFYLTTHSEDPETIFSRMRLMSQALKAANVQVIREKIELIIHDTKNKSALTR